MVRLANWQSSLSAYITATANTPFKYGFLDCGLFVAGGIEAMTGIDVAAELRGTYTNRVEAFAAIRRVCGSGSMQAIAEHLARENGIPSVSLLCAQRGDPVVLQYGSRSSLGIVDLHGSFILTPFKDGLLRLPLSQATQAFHVG